MIDAFRDRVNARLVLLPPHDPQFRRNRERVIRDAERFRQFKYVLIDEAHYVNAKGGMYRSFLDVRAGLAFPISDRFSVGVGGRWDARFGPVVLVGTGGTATEVLADVEVALGPVDEAEAERMLRRLRTAPLLDAHRGRAALDVGAAARAVAAVSRFAAAHPEIAELELNPLLVTPTGAVGLDARIVTHRGDED